MHNNLKGKVTAKISLLLTLCAVCICCAIFAFVGFNNSDKANAATVISGNTYTISGTSDEMAAGWAQAVAASSEDKQVTVVLGNDWTAKNGMFGLNGTAFSNGALCVPLGRNISLNLAGYRLDRGLTSAVDGGSVIVVKGSLFIDSIFTRRTGNGVEYINGDTVITGGYTTGNGGGVLVDGGNLILKRAYITGNRANGNGGGVYINSGSFSIRGWVDDDTRTGMAVVGNHSNGKANNVYLKEGQTINVLNQMSVEWRTIIRVGVTLERGTGVFTTNFGQVTDGATASLLRNANMTPASIFFADDFDNYIVKSTIDEISTEAEGQLVPASQDTNGAMAKKWNKAIFDSINTGTQVSFDLTENWEAQEETVYTQWVTSFGTGIGFINGVIAIPYGADIKMDLKGKTIDRKMFETENEHIFGYVLGVTGGDLDLYDSVGTGVIRGARSSEVGAIISSQNSTLTIYGGTIRDNYGRAYGGAFTGCYGTVIMRGGKLCNNSTDNTGGAICVGNTSTVIIYDCEITENTASIGGGIGYTSNKNRLEIYGGTITNNTSSNGGGIYANSSAGLILYGTSEKGIVIEDNQTTGASGGIYLGASTVTNIKGKISIQNNVGSSNTTPVTRNWYFAGSGTTKSVIVDGALTNSKIGISYQKANGQISTGFGANNKGVNVSSIFFADDSANYKIAEAIGADAEVVLVAATVSGDLVCLPIALTNLVYNGNFQNIFEGYNAAYMSAVISTSRVSTEGVVIQTSSDGKYIQGKQAGTYYVDFTLLKGAWADGTAAATRTVSVVISKASYDMTGIYMENVRVKGDTTSKASVMTLKYSEGVTKLPTGLTLGSPAYTYTKNGAEVTAAQVIAAGEYTVTANIVNSDTINYNNPAAISAVLYIVNTTSLNVPTFVGGEYQNKTSITLKYSRSAREFNVQEYTGTNLQGLNIIPSTGLTLSGGKLTVTAKLAAGEYQVSYIIKNTNNYEWSDETTDARSLTIIIENYEFADYSITEIVDFTYDGTEHNVIASKSQVLDSSCPFTPTVVWDYKLSTESGWKSELKVMNAGSYTINWRLEAEGYEPITGNLELTVNRFSLNGLNSSTLTFNASAFSNLTYNGTAHTPTPTVTIPGLAGNKTLAATEYSFEYDNNVNAGTNTADITVVAKNVNFSGRCTLHFSINQKNISTAVFAAIPDQTYKSSEVKPTTGVTIALTNGTATLTAGTDFDWDYTYDSDLTNVGTHSIQIVGKGNYTGNANTSFEIVKATLTITLGGGDATYDGLAHAPTTATITGLLGTDGNTITQSAVLGMLAYGKSATGYDINRIKAGEYVATVNWATSGIYRNYKLADNCNAVTGYHFTIAKATIAPSDVHISGIDFIYDGTMHYVTNQSANSVDNLVSGSSVTWHYSKDGSAYSTDVPQLKDVALGGGTYTIHYKVAVDNYETFNGTFTLKSTPRELSTAALAISNVSPLTYNGTAQVPSAYTVKDTVAADNVLTLIPGTDFTAAYSNNVNASVNGAVITLTGTGNFTGTATLNYSIAKKEITVSWSQTGTPESSTGGKPQFTYNGAGQGWVATAVGAENGEDVAFTVLYEGTDTAGVAYSAATLPKNAGSEYTVTVALADAWTGNYEIASGEDTSKTFEILRKKIASVSGLTVKNGGKEYDGTSAAEIDLSSPNFGTGVIVGGDEVTVASATGNYTVYTYSSSARSVSITAITLGGKDKENYTLVNNTASTTALINKRVLTLDWGNTRLLFTGSALLPSVSATNLVGSEKVDFTVTVIGSPAVYPGTGYKAQAALVDSNVSQNYALPADPTVTFEIYSNNIVISIDTAGLVYDGTVKHPDLYYTNESGTVHLTYGVDYTVEFSARVGATLTDGVAINAGDYTAVITITATYMWPDNDTYLVKKSFDFTVAKAECDLSAVTFGPSFTHTYNGALPNIAAGDVPAGVKSVEYKYYAGETEISAAEAVNFGSYTVVAVFTADSNYAFKDGVSEKRATLTINKANINLDGLSFVGAVGGTVTLTYDGKVHGLTLSGTAEGVSGISFTYVKGTQTVPEANVIGAGTYSVTATFTADSNHAFTGLNYKTATLVIEQAALTVIANDSSVVYGDAPKDGGATFNGLVGGEDASVLGALTFNINYSQYGNVGAYGITVNAFTGAGAANYDIEYKGGTLTVTPREISVKWQRTAQETSTDFTYTQSGSTVFCPYPVLVGVQGTDVISVTVTGGTSVPGFGYEAVVTAINGTKSANYTLPVNGLKVSFDVLPSPKSGKIIWDNSTLYYNGGEQLPKAYYYATDDATKPVELDVVVVGSTKPVNAGSYTAKIVNAPDLQGSLTKEFKIERREVYIVIGDLTSAIGATVDFTKVSWSYLAGSDEFVSGENYTLSFSADYDKNVGKKYAIHGNFSSNNAANYKVTFTGSWTSTDENNGRCGTLTVAKAAFDPSTLAYTGTDVTYDGAKHEITVVGLPDGVTAKLTYNKGFASWTDGVTDAGKYTVTVDFVYDSAAYDAIPSVTVEMNIKKASLEVKANDNTVYYGDEAAANGYVVLGTFFGGDDESVFGGAITYTFGGYTSAGNAGRYLITPAGLTADNYDITFVPGALTVAPRTITVTWFDYASNGTQGSDFTYRYTDGSSEFKPYAVAGGLVNGDEVILEVSGGQTAPGTGYIATAVLSDGNYALPADGTATATFSIIPDADDIAVWVNKELVYDGTAYTPEAYYFKDGEKQTGVTVTVYADEACTEVVSGGAVNAGTYYAKVTKTDGGALANDTFAFTVQPRKVTVVIEDCSKVFGQANPSFTVNYAAGSDEFIGSTISSLISVSCAADANSSVGKYAINGTYIGGNNYEVTILNGTLTVEKATISGGLPALSGSASVDYDGKAHTLTADIEGFAGISGVKYTYYKVASDGTRTEISAGEIVGAGNYVIVATFTADGNYKFADGADNFVEGTLTINKLTISGSLELDTSVTQFTYDGKAHTLLLKGSADGVKEINYTYYKYISGVKTQISAGETAGVGSYFIEVTLVFDSDNYTYGGNNPLTSEFTIVPAEVTVTARKTVVYGQNTGVAQSELTVNGLIGGDTLESLGVTLTVTVQYGGSYGTDVGVYGIAISGDELIGNYKFVFENGELTVTPKVITADDVEWFSNAALNEQNFVYYYSASASYHPYARVKDGVLVAGDSLAFVYGEGKTQVGFGYTVDIKGTGNKNYVLDAKGITSRSFDILENPVKEYEIVWNYSVLYYNGGEQRPEAYYYDGDNNRVKLTVTVDEGSAVNVGTYTARVSAGSLKLTGESVINFSIERRRVYIHVGNAQAVYGETPNMNTVEWSYAYDDENTHIVAGETFNITFSHETVTGFGEYRINGHFSSAKGTNYQVIFTGDWASTGEDNGCYGVLTVVKATVDLTHVAFGNSQIVYDGNAHSLIVTGVPEGVSYNLSYTDGTFAYGAAGVTNAGLYTVEITFYITDESERANYEDIPVMIATFEIRKAALTVNANDNTVIYGDEAADGGAVISGFVNGETLETSDVLGGVEYSINYARYGAAGKYRITPFGLTSDNYEITYVSGTLTVAPRAVTVEWFDDATRSTKNFTYGADGVTVFAPYAVAGNLVNGDKVTLTVTGGQKEAGAGYVARAQIADNANYTLPADGSASVRFDVLPAPMTIIWEKTPFTYNGTAQKPAAYYFDESGKKHDLEVTVDGGECTDAGDYVARATIPAGLTLDGNYTCEYTIAKLVISIIVGDVTATYGENIPFGAQWWSYADGSDKFVSGDEALVTRNEFANPDAGTYDITATFGGSADNYSFSFVKGTLTVNKAVVSGTPVFGDKTEVYDGGVHTVEVDISALAGVTGVIYTYEKDGVSYGSNGVTEAGVYFVTAHFTADGNHIAPGDITVKLTITGSEIDLDANISFNDNTSAIYNGTAQKILISGSAEGVTGVTYTYYRKSGSTRTPISESEVVNAGEYVIVATFTADNNHSFKGGKNTLEANLTIGAANLAVKANGVTVVYGEAAVTNGYTLSGLAAGDTETSVGLTVNMAINGYIAGVTEVGSLNGAVTLTATVASANYTITAQTGASVTVIPREITADEVFWYTSADDSEPSDKIEYTYNGGEFTPYAVAIVNGKTVALTVSGGRTEIGANYTAKISSVEDKNYSLPAGGITTTFSILSEIRAGVIIWDNSPLYYNGENRKPEAYYLVDGSDEKHFLEVTVSGNSRIVGKYTATVSPDASLHLTGAKSIQFEVLPLPVIIEIGDYTAVYGEEITLGDTNWNYAAGSAHFLDGEAFTVHITTDGKNAGKHKIAGEFSSANGANYDVSFVGSWASGDADNGKYGTLTIVKATIDISGLKVEGTEVDYDGNPHALTISGLPEGVKAHFAYSLNGWNCLPENVKGAGVYNVTVTFTIDTEDADNYNPVPPVNLTLTISPATVRVTANNNTIVYGDRPSANGATITGADPSLLGGTLTYTFDYRQYQGVGRYTITPSGLTSDNYEIIFVPGVLTVEKRVISIEWFDDDTLGSKNFKYTYVNNSTFFTPYAHAGNLVNGDIVNLTVAGAAAEAGMNYVATVTAIDNANYALPAGTAVSQSFDIVPPSRVVIWDNTPIYYNGEKQAPKAYCYDENGKLIELAVNVNGDTGVIAVGEGYLASVTDTTGLTGSYSIVFGILPREITVVINNKTAVYGHVSEVIFDAILAEGSLGFVGDDTINILRFECSATDLSGVGDYEIICSYAGGNYTVTVVTGTLTITNAPASIAGVVFGGKTVDYTGETYTVEISGGLPAGVSGVSYAYYLLNGDGTRTPVGSDGVRSAGTYEVVATFAAADNYYLTGDNTRTVTLIVMQAEITGDVALNSATLTYNGSEQHVYATGTAQGVTGVSYKYYAGDYTAAGATLPGAFLTGVKDAGVYTVVATFTVDGNYKPLADKRALVTVDKATLTVSAEDVIKEYLYAFSAADFGYSYSGLIGGDTVDFSALNITVTANYNDGTYGNDAGVYDIIITGGADAGNYKVVYENGKLTVKPYELKESEIVWQVSGSDTSTALVYEYDGTEHTPYAYADVTANGETVNLAVAGGQTNAGNDYLARVTAIVGNANYTLPAGSFTATFTVTPVPVNLHIVWENTTVYYDGNPHAPSAYFTTDDGAKHDLVVTVDGNENATLAGTYTATATLANGNYSLVGNSAADFTILPAEVYIEISDIPYAVYGEVSGVAAGWNYRADSVRLEDGAENGLSFTVHADDTTPVGKYKITGAFDGDTYSNYKVNFLGSWVGGDADNGRCGTITIGKATFDMSGIVIGSRTAQYSGGLQQLSITNLPDGVEAVLSYRLGDWSFGNEGVLNVGRYGVVIGFVITDENDRANYNAIPSVNEEFEITRVQLTVKANDSVITYGDAPAAAGIDWSAAGFVNGEDEKVLKGSLSFTYDYRQYQRVGDYSVTAGGLTSDNYDITYVPGTLTVVPRTVEVIWYSENGGRWGTEFSYKYDGSVHQPYAVAGNVVNNDAITLTVSGGRSEAGMGYVARATAISGSSNYVLPTDGSEKVIFNIQPAAYVIVWESTDFVYNGEEQVPKAYYFTPYGGKVELKVTADRYAADAGEYIASAERFPGDASPITGEFDHRYTIDKLAVSIIIEDSGSQYGDEIVIDPDGWHYADGSGKFTDGNFITLKCSVEVGAGVGAYANAITCDFSNPNYEVTYRNGTYTVSKKVLSLPEIASVDYDGEAHTATVDADAPYYIATGVADITKTHAGSYNVVLALKDPANYSWDGTQTVTIEVSFVINKVKNGWVNGYEFAIQGGTVQAGSGVIEVNDYKTLFDTTITVKYYRDETRLNEVTEEFVTNSATLGDRFFVVVTAEGTGDFEGFEYETTVTVEGKLRITLEWLDEILTYDGTPQAPRAFVWIGSERIWLEVDGAATAAGENYVATAKRTALGGTDLSDYEFSNPDGDFTKTFSIAARKLTVSIDDGFNVVYGSVRSDRVDLSRLGWTISSGRLVDGDTLDDLGISFVCDFGGLSYANVGSYAITGEWTNGNYDIEFIGDWNGDDELNGKAGTYTVTPATLTVDKTGSEWVDDENLDDGALIELYQNYFVTLGEKNDDGTYKYIRLKGDQSAEVNINYSAIAYNYGSAADIPVMSDAQIAQYIKEGQTVSPEIKQAGVWVVYYRIQVDNHFVKYGQWRVLILKNTDYVTVNFEKPYSVAYGDSVEGKNIIGELIDGGYISVSGAITDLEVLRRYVEAYAYEDLGNGTAVGGSTGANRYTICFALNEEGQALEEFANVAFRYKSSNDPNEPDSNIGAYEITRRELSIVWGVTSFEYDGTAKIPSAKLIGLIGGEEAELALTANGTYTLTLANGDVIYLDTELVGDSAINAGSFRLIVSLENPNYVLSQTGNFADVTVAKKELSVVWGDREFTYDGAIKLPSLTVAGKQIEYSLESGSVTVELTLDNGDVVPLTVSLVNGKNTKDDGSYTLALTLGDDNYSLSNLTDRVTVTITDTGRVGLPTWAIVAIAVGCALAVIVIIVLISVLRKRNKKISEYDGKVDDEGFNDPV